MDYPVPPSAPVVGNPFEYRQQPSHFSPDGRPTAESNCPGLSEEQIIDALDNYVQGKCCYGDAFLKEMKIKDILTTPIFGYDLEFFIEKRTKEWVTEPYRGEYLDQGQSFGVPVDIWSLRVQPPIHFGTSKQIHTLPGSVSVVNCAQCTGIGNIQCGNCAGSMTTSCNNCMGSGTVNILQPDGTTKNLRCIKCKGTRRTKCDSCEGKGTATCKTCQGFRRVKNFEKVEINWIIVLEQSSHKNGGEIQLVTNRLNNLKKRLVAEIYSPTPQDLLQYQVFRPLLDSKYTYQCSIPHQRILEIRQRVYQYQGTEVICTYDSRDHKFLVFGEERVIYFPQGYPRSCTIL